MKVAILLALIGVAAAGRLENVYLPPGSAASAGGAAFVRAPGSGATHGAHSGSLSAGSYQGNAGSYQGNAGSYQGNAGSYQGSVGSYQSNAGSYQSNAGSYQSNAGSYQGNAGSYQGNAGYRGQAIEILKYNNDNNGDGSYQFNYETANGISAQEAGALQGDSEVVRGSYSYTGPDGVQYTIQYTADENGFHAEGAHLPTPPPIPEEIRKGVELSLAAEARGENQDGQYNQGPASQNYNRYQNANTANTGYQY